MEEVDLLLSSGNSCENGLTAKCDLNCRNSHLNSGLERKKRGLSEECTRYVKPRTLFNSFELTSYDKCQPCDETLNCDTVISPPNLSAECLSQSLVNAETSEPSTLDHRLLITDDVSPTSPSVEAIPTCSSFHINSLPYVSLVHILCQLPLSDRLLRAALVCHYWRQLTQDSGLWREIDLKGYMKVSDDVLTTVVEYNKRVVSIDITDCRKVTDVGIGRMLVRCKSLMKLNLTRCWQITEQTFRSISENSKNLKELNLSCCSALDDTALALIGGACRSLVDLRLNQCSKVTDRGINDLVWSSSKLETLFLDQCIQLRGEWIQFLLIAGGRLKSLSCRECPITANNIMLLSKLPELSHLEIAGNSNVTDEVVIALSRGCPKLQYLNLSLCQKVTNQAVAHLVKHNRCLKSLNLVSCSIDNKALEFLAECQTLQSLDVAYCCKITADAALLVSSRCRNLRYLGLMRCDLIADKEAEMLDAKFPHIRYSTMHLDFKRVIEKAELQGFVIKNCGRSGSSQRALAG